MAPKNRRAPPLVPHRLPRGAPERQGLLSSLPAAVACIFPGHRQGAPIESCKTLWLGSIQRHCRFKSRESTPAVTRPSPGRLTSHGLSTDLKPAKMDRRILALLGCHRPLWRPTCPPDQPLLMAGFRFTTWRECLTFWAGWLRHPSAERTFYLRRRRKGTFRIATTRSKSPAINSLLIRPPTCSSIIASSIGSWKRHARHFMDSTRK